MVKNQFVAGDHTLYIGEVTDILLAENDHGTAHICTPKTCTLEIDELYQINSNQELDIKIKWLNQLIETNLLAN